MADHFLVTGQLGAGGQVVERAYERGDPGQRGPVSDLGWHRARLPRDVPVEVAQDLPMLIVDAQEPRCARPPGRLEMAE